MDNDFDKKIKEELDAFRLSGESSDWAEFEHKLEMAELEADLSFDANMAEQLAAVSIEQGADWPAMEEKIAVERSRRYQVYRMKATELLIFFLLLYTFFQIYPVQLQKQALITGPLIADRINVVEKPVYENNQAESTSGDVIENDLQVAPSTEKIIKTESAERFLEAEIERIPTHTSADVISTITTNALSEIINTEALHVLATDRSVQNIEFEDLPSLSSEISYTFEPNIAFSKLKLNKNLFGKSIWINFYAGMDLDIITTPYDEVYGLNAYTQFSGSNRFGTSISFYQELLEWETGLNYTQKQFQPKLLVKEISGRSSGEYAETSLQNISFSILQIPLQMKYHFVTFKGWRSYAMLGSSLNIVADAKYDVRLKILSDTPNYVGPTPVPEPKINDKEFSNGVLSNGSFYSNSYFTLNAGIGLQKGITGNTALFIEHSYQHHIFSGGIGPNANKLNNFTLVTGIKTNILRR